VRGTARLTSICANTCIHSRKLTISDANVASAHGECAACCNHATPNGKSPVSRANTFMNDWLRVVQSGISAHAAHWVYLCCGIEKPQQMRVFNHPNLARMAIGHQRAVHVFHLRPMDFGAVMMLGMVAVIHPEQII